MIQRTRPLFLCLASLALALLALAAEPGELPRREPRPNGNARAAEIEGDWTVVYLKRGTGLSQPDRVDARFFPTKVKFAKGKMEQDEKPAATGSLAYEVEPGGKQGVLAFFRLDANGQIVEKTRSEPFYYLRDDFLLVANNSGFSVAPEHRPYVTIYRRGKLQAPWISQTFAKESQPKEQQTIEGTWIKIYYEGQGFFFSLVNMEDLTAAHQSTGKKVPFSENIPLQWKVSKSVIDEGGESEDSHVRRFAYQLKPEAGMLDLIPLDKGGTAIDKATKEAIYFVKGDFLFVRYQLEPQRWRPSRPDRVFTSDTQSRTGLLIFRRAP